MFSIMSNRVTLCASFLVRVVPLGIDFVYVTIEHAEYAQGASFLYFRSEINIL